MIRNASLHRRAVRVIPGGVNSPVRAFRAVGGDPPFIARGKGPYVFDSQGRKYIDLLCSWGPLILGHAHPAIIRAIQQTARRGTTFGAATEREIQLAELIRELIPSIRMVRLVSSGTEALMSVVRLARAATRRNHILKFTGGYHGHADSFLVAAGSGAATFGHPSSPGVPHQLARLTSVLPYNDLHALHRFFQKKGNTLAAVVVEPVAANAGVIPPKSGFLEATRYLSQKYGALLIFDEVVTGFRLGLGGAQDFFGIRPDLTCLGKILGGGLPLAAFGGREDLMRQLSPEGSVYQAGTLSGNPLAVAAGIAALRLLKSHPPYAMLDERSARLAEGLSRHLGLAGIAHRINRVGSMMTLFFTDRDVASFEDAKDCDIGRFASFHRAARRLGVYLPPSQFEAWFVSTAHSAAVISEIIRRMARAVHRL